MRWRKVGTPAQLSLISRFIFWLAHLMGRKMKTALLVYFSVLILKRSVYMQNVWRLEKEPASRPVSNFLKHLYFNLCRESGVYVSYLMSMFRRTVKSQCSPFSTKTATETHTGVSLASPTDLKYTTSYRSRFKKTMFDLYSVFSSIDLCGFKTDT